MGKCTEGIECKEPVEYARNIYGHDRVAGIARENILVDSPRIVRVSMMNWWAVAGSQDPAGRPGGGKGEV